MKIRPSVCFILLGLLLVLLFAADLLLGSVSLAAGEVVRKQRRSSPISDYPKPSQLL